MAAIHDLLAQIGDERLRERLRAEWAKATRERKFVGWEAGVLAEEPAPSDVLGWLRDVDCNPWALEVPCETGGEVRPMDPDLVIVRRDGDGLSVDILEPHDPSLADNVDKARGLARIAGRRGGLFGRIQLIRKLLAVSQPAQLDALFDGVH